MEMHGAACSTRAWCIETDFYLVKSKRHRLGPRPHYLNEEMVYHKGNARPLHGWGASDQEWSAIDSRLSTETCSNKGFLRQEFRIVTHVDAVQGDLPRRQKERQTPSGRRRLT